MLAEKSNGPSFVPIFLCVYVCVLNPQTCLVTSACKGIVTSALFFLPICQFLTHLSLSLPFIGSSCEMFGLVSLYRAIPLGPCFLIYCCHHRVKIAKTLVCIASLACAALIISFVPRIDVYTFTSTYSQCALIVCAVARSCTVSLFLRRLLIICRCDVSVLADFSKTSSFFYYQPSAVLSNRSVSTYRLITCRNVYPEETVQENAALRFQPVVVMKLCSDAALFNGYVNSSGAFACFTAISRSAACKAAKIACKADCFACSFFFFCVMT